MGAYARRFVYYFNEGGLIVSQAVSRRNYLRSSSSLPTWRSSHQTSSSSCPFSRSSPPPCPPERKSYKLLRRFTTSSRPKLLQCQRSSSEQAVWDLIPSLHSGQDGYRHISLQAIRIGSLIPQEGGTDFSADCALVYLSVMGICGKV